MSSSLLTDEAADPSLVPVWRNYWSKYWDRTPDWRQARLDSFMSAAEGREEEYMPAGQHGRDDHNRSLLQGRVIYDYPDGKGVFIGALPRPVEQAGVIQFSDPGHLLTVAPTRTGKGTCHIVPNLLLYAGSAVVIDIKGENYDITARHRATFFERARVIKFAPFEESSACYNPLNFIRSEEDGGPTTDTIDDARLLAEMLIPGKSNEPFWDMESRNVATMLIAYVASANPRESSDRTMAEVARLLFRNEGPGDDEKFNLTINEIIAFAKEISFESLKALAAAFDEHEERLRDNILSSCRTDLLIWTNERLQSVTGHSSFEFSELKESMCRPVSQDPAPTTLYIVIPPEYLSSYQPIIRLMIGLSVTELTREGFWVNTPGYRKRPPCPVLFMLDELPALGSMKPIVNGLTYLAGYDVRIWTFAQNLGQLRQIYGDAWHNFPANSAVTSFFGVNDLETADFVSRQLGETEEEIVHYETQSISSGRSSSFNFGGLTSGSSNSSGDNSSTTTQEHQRVRREMVARPSDVRSTHKDLQYVFIRNRKPILGTKVDYYNFGLFKNLYGAWRQGDGDAK